MCKRAEKCNDLRDRRPAASKLARRVSNYHFVPSRRTTSATYDVGSLSGSRDAAVELKIVGLGVKTRMESLVLPQNHEDACTGQISRYAADKTFPGREEPSFPTWITCKHNTINEYWSFECFSSKSRSYDLWSLIFYLI